MRRQRASAHLPTKVVPCMLLYLTTLACGGGGDLGSASPPTDRTSTDGSVDAGAGGSLGADGATSHGSDARDGGSMGDPSNPADGGDLGDARAPDAADGGPNDASSTDADDAGGQDAQGLPEDAGSSSPDSGAVVTDPLTPGSRTISTSAGGFDRQILLVVPRAWRVGDAAVIALHGNGDSASNFLASTGLQTSAEARAIALAAPRAMSGHFRGLDWDAYTRPASSNPDIAVVEAAYAILRAGGADPARIYLLGYSQGGFLSYRVAMERAELFAAGHLSGASSPLPGYGLEDRATRKIPVDLLIGAGDSLVSNARASRDLLERLGFEVRYTELAGVGHCCPLRNRAGAVLDWFLDRRL